MDGYNNNMSVGEWMLTLFISFIPIVNIIMLFVWGFGSSTAPNKANWAKAMLAWIAIMIVVYMLIILAFGATILSNM
jgi:hypothetical protein